MKKGIRILAFSLVVFFSLAAFAISTVAWFASGTYISFGQDTGNVNVFGGSDADYYESGSGTENDPYVISSRIHLYNLAWLQYIGYYNERITVFEDSDAEDDIVQCYFVLKNDIDMQGLTIPPIGTNKYPFLGHFSGAGIDPENPQQYKVSNFTISNDDPEQDNSDFGVAKPDDLYEGEQPDVVGFFGVIGKLPNQNITYDPSIVSVSDFLLSDFTVVSKTNQVLIGLAGGYVNGEMSGVKVGNNAKIDVNGQVSTAKANITSNLSDYGLVGYSTRMDNSGGAYRQELSKLYANYDTSQPEGQGQGNEWGGSINFKDFNLRLKSQLTNGETVATGSYVRFRKYSSTYVDASAYNGSGVMTNVVNKDPTTTRVIYNLLGKGQHTVKISGTNYTADMPGTIEPLLMAQNSYSDPDAVNNTGYIVSATSSGTAGTIRSASYELRFIANALGDSTYESYQVNAGTNTGYTNGTALSFPSYDKTKFEVLTNSSTTYGASNYCFIKDELAGYNSSHTPNYNYTKSDSTTPTTLKLTKYNNARQTLNTVLSNASYVHGMHFMGTTVSYDKYVQRSNLKILGETMPNDYKLPTSSIDFNLKEDGKINLFAGSYYSHGTPVSSTARPATRYDGDSDSFFTLYHINRSNGDLVSGSIKKISKIFKNTDTTVNRKYVYQYSDNSYSSGTKGDAVFDLAYLENSPVNNAVYYFEIPVDAGEYALGAVSGSTAGAYLMYLDIGASGETKDRVDAHYITTVTSGVAHPIGVDFNVNGSGNNGGDSFGFAIASSNRGTVKVEISTNSNENDAVTVVQSSTIATYSYRKNNYNNYFSITGMSGNPPSGNSESIKVFTINLKTTGGDRYNIVITDNQTTSTTTYAVVKNGETQSGYSTDASIEALSSSEISMTNIRALPVVATLTRTNGTAEFYTEYNISGCNNTTVDVTITLNNTTISATVTNGYTFVANGSPVANGGTIS